MLAALLLPLALGRKNNLKKIKKNKKIDEIFETCEILL